MNNGTKFGELLCTRKLQSFEVSIYETGVRLKSGAILKKERAFCFDEIEAFSSMEFQTFNADVYVGKTYSWDFHTNKNGAFQQGNIREIFNFFQLTVPGKRNLGGGFLGFGESGTAK